MEKSFFFFFYACGISGWKGISLSFPVFLLVCQEMEKWYPPRIGGEERRPMLRKVDGIGERRVSAEIGEKDF